MADDLRPELFDEPLARSEAEHKQAYGEHWLDDLIEEMEGEGGAADKPAEIETEDNFLPTRDSRKPRRRR
jgi:hypothetical protein